MLTYEARRRVNRPPEAVFDVIGTHVYENHPKWESEVVEIRPLTEPPVRVGSRAVMVRREYGRTSEVTYEVTDFDQDRRIAFRHISTQMAFEIAFALEPVGEGGSELAVQIRAQPKGAFRLMTPLVARNLPRTSERITSQMVALVESQR
ncbi:MAG: SRPBCC family protein [Candidatus Limnocylindria bacterium]